MITTTDMALYHVQDVLPHAPVELWDTLCSQDHANHDVICSRPTGKDTVGGTDWWDTRHISIPGFWFLQSGMVQRRCRTWINQTREIPRRLPSHRISHELLGFASKRNTDVQNNRTTIHIFGITNRTMQETIWGVQKSNWRNIQSLAGDDKIFHEDFSRVIKNEGIPEADDIFDPEEFKNYVNMKLHWIGKTMDLNFQESTRDERTNMVDR